jgi:hypothetical protein
MENLIKRINIGPCINVRHGKFGKKLRSFVMKKTGENYFSNF